MVSPHQARLVSTWFLVLASYRKLRCDLLAFVEVSCILYISFIMNISTSILLFECQNKIDIGKPKGRFTEICAISPEQVFIDCLVLVLFLPIRIRKIN